MIKKYRFGLKHYYHPTPARMRKLGDAMLGSAQFLTGYAIIMDEKWLALVVLAMGSIGKFITNFYSEPTEADEKITNQV